MLQSLRLTTKCPSADTQYRQHPKKGQVSSPIFIQLFLSFGALDKILKIHLYIYLSSQLVMLRFVRVEVWTPWLSSQDHWLNNVERPVATFNTAPIFPLFWFWNRSKRAPVLSVPHRLPKYIQIIGLIYTFIKALQAFCWKTKRLRGTATQELHCHLEDWEHRGRHDRGMSQVYTFVEFHR